MPIKELAIHALADIGICARGHIFWWKVYRNDDADVVATLLQSSYVLPVDTQMREMTNDD